MKHADEMLRENANAHAFAQEDWLWTDIRELELEGQGWKHVKRPFDRLPATAENKVPRRVWTHSLFPTGIAARFRTPSRRIRLDWRLFFRTAIEHMSPIGLAGIDVYAKDGCEWRWVAAGTPERGPISTLELLDIGPPGVNEYLVYLPAFTSLRSLRIGVEPRVSLCPGDPYPRDSKPICFYGTSLTQGASATRPGMAYPAIVGRRMLRSSINLGFSGAGKLDMELAALLGELDVAIFVLDCTPNLTQEMIGERCRPFVRALRQLRPVTPIVLVEAPRYQNAWFFPRLANRYTESNIALRESFQALTAEGDTKLHYIEGEDLVGHDDEASVANHATDLAFVRYANVLVPRLRGILAETPFSGAS